MNKTLTHDTGAASRISMEEWKSLLDIFQRIVNNVTERGTENEENSTSYFVFKWLRYPGE